jgi:hypothetical protein
VGHSFFSGDSHPGGFTAGRANQHDIGDMNRSLELDNTGRHAPALGLYLTLVFLPDIDTLYGNPPLVPVNLDHFAAFTLISLSTADDLDSITFVYFVFHNNYSCFPII